MKLLLLEDNSTDADLAKIGLSRHIPNIIIEHAFTLEQARFFLQENKSFDIALLDVNLPDGNGLEFLMEIRQRNLTFPVVMLTGSGDEESAVTALKSGAEDYVLKRTNYIEHLPEIINQAIINFKKNALSTSAVIDILYIEHHIADVDFTIRHFAQYAPYIHIEAVSTADEALLKLNHSEKYKVILMDYRLPGMDALELIKTIRQKIKLDTPIILVTGQGSESLAVQALKLGANDYLTKSKNYLVRLPNLIINSYQHYELKRKQSALIESETKYRLIADNSGDTIFVLDMDLNYTYISPAILNIRGYTPEEAMSHKISDVLTPTSYEKTKKTISELLSSKAHLHQNEILTKTIELELIKKDKSTVWTEVKASLLSDENKKPVGFLGVTRDITEKKIIIDELIKAKEKAEESDRLKSAFLANISHEIRTPMNGILGFAQLLKEPGLSGSEQRDYIKIIEKSGNRMLNIINDIVDISKIEAGMVETRISETNINDQLDYAFTFFKPEANKKGIELIQNSSLPKQEAILHTDREKLYAILLNLINNAIKYTDAGKIEIGYKVIKTNDNNFIEFYISDTGIGISPAQQEAVFERFIQVDISNTQARQGAGLGLSISKAFVTLLGGTIRVESQEGKGSTFYFTVPYSPIQPIVEVEKKNLTRNDYGIPKNIKILIAEDDDISEKLLTLIIKPICGEFLIARNGAEAVELCKSNPDIDIVLMDIQMPVMNGYEATRQIRLFNNKVKIIAQTAFALSGDEEKIMNSGCNSIINKPIKEQKLLMAIKENLN